MPVDISNPANLIATRHLWQNVFVPAQSHPLHYAVTAIDRYPALIPPMTWAQSIAPTAPTTLKVRHTKQGDQLSWSGAKDRSDGPYLLYNIYASREKPVDTSNPANLIATHYLWQSLQVPHTATASHFFHYAVTALDRYGNESEAVQEPTVKPSVNPERQPLTPITQRRNPWRK